jgi:GNAT superfamily N-acetyltransferase/predicted ester cyclase
MTPPQLVLDWFEMCRTGDEARFAELAAGTFAGHGPGGTTDRAGFLAWLRWYPTAFVDQRSVVEDVVESGDRVVVRYTTRSTYRGGFLDLPARGQPVEETGVIIFRLAGGRVAETWFQGNDLEVAQQLGGRVTPAVLVRVADAGDVAVLRGVFRRASLHNAGDREVLLAHPEALVWSGEAIGGGRVRVAVEDGRVAGFATTVPIDGGLELEDLFVEPDRMRRGVGRRLVEDVLDTARAEGVEHVWVTANPHAMAFYAAVGFVPDGTASTRFGPAPRLRLDVPESRSHSVGGRG